MMMQNRESFDNSSVSEGSNGDISSSYSSDGSSVEEKYNRMTLKDIHTLVSKFEKSDFSMPTKIKVEPKKRINRKAIVDVPARTPKMKVKKKKKRKMTTRRKRVTSSVESTQTPNSKMLMKNIRKLRGEIVALEARNKLQQQLFTGAKRRFGRKKKKKGKTKSRLMGAYRVSRPCRLRKGAHSCKKHGLKKNLKKEKKTISKQVSKIDSNITKLQNKLKTMRESIGENSSNIETLRSDHEKMFGKYSEKFSLFEKRQRKKMNALKSKVETIDLNTSQNSRRIETIEKRNNRMDETIQRHAQQLDRMNLRIAKVLLKATLNTSGVGLNESIPKIDDLEIRRGRVEKGDSRIIMGIDDAVQRKVRGKVKTFGAEKMKI